MKPMLLTDSSEVPVENGWLYETKYDGFRCILTWEKDKTTPILKSRNDLVLNKMFPEIIQFCHSIYKDVEPYLPLMFDGELVYLTNDFQSDFSIVQKRGRMRNDQTIEQHAKTFPCIYIAFDLLQWEGKLKTTSQLKTRKQLLEKCFETLDLPTSVDFQNAKRVQVYI